jgi:excisionase family DNA binding protein
MTQVHPNSQALESRLLGIEEAVLFLGVTARSLYRLVEKGMLTPVRLPGFRRTLFDRQDLEALVQSAKGQVLPKDHAQPLPEEVTR